ncbi:MAG TPA: HAD family phosphatase [Anaerolineales bacterium]
MNTPTNIEAVIWDLGGVIMRTDDPAPRTVLASRFGLSYADLAARVLGGPESTRAQLGEISAQQFWEGAGAAYGMAPADFMAAFFAGDSLDHELLAAIRGLCASYKVGLLSNAFSDLRYWLEQEWKIADAFNSLVISAEVKLMKPDPAIYTLALEQLGVKPQAAVFVDDVPVNIEAAQRAGMHGIVFRSRLQTLGELDRMLGRV